MVRLALVHAAANALLLWLGYYWLGMGESSAATLAWSGLVALALLAGACWTSAVPPVYFHGETGAPVRLAWRRAVRNVPPLLAVAVAMVAIYVALAQVSKSSRAIDAVRFVAIPVLLFPVVAEVAAHGWRGFAKAAAWRGRWLCVLLVPVWLYVPYGLIRWVPGVGGAFWLESISFTVRAAAAYLIFVLGWLVLARLASGGSPVFSQDKTVVSP